MLDGENAGGALGPADIKEELFDNVHVHYRQPEVIKGFAHIICTHAEGYENTP